MEPISPDVVWPTKACTICKEVKPAAEFSRDRSSKSGLYRRCKPCDKAATLQWRQDNRDVISERGRKWRQENPEYLVRYRAQNPDKMKQWHAERPLYNKLNMGKLRAERAGAEAHDITEEDLLTYWRSVGIDPNTCFYTGAPLEGDWHIDHMTPICKGGTHTLGNLVPCTPLANNLKASHAFEDFAVPIRPREVEPGCYEVFNRDKRYTVRRLPDDTWHVTNHRKRVISQASSVYSRVVTALTIFL